MKRLILTLSVFAASAAFASENSGNMRNTIAAIAAQEAPLVQLQEAALAQSVEARKWLQDSIAFDAAPIVETAQAAVAAVVEPTKEAVQQVSPVMARAKTWLFDQLQKASGYLPSMDDLKTHYAKVDAKLGLNNKVAAIRESAALKYAQEKYSAALNSNAAQKVFDYANRGTEFVKEHPKTIAAIAAGTTAVALTTWLVKKWYTHKKENDSRVVVKPADYSALYVEPKVASIYPTEDMESYQAAMIERDRIEGNTPNIYPRIS